MNANTPTKRKPYRVQARSTEWTNADGTTDPIVKLYGGSRGSIALDYSEVPKLIAALAKLLADHQEVTHGQDPQPSA